MHLMAASASGSAQKQQRCLGIALLAEQFHGCISTLQPRTLTHTHVMRVRCLAPPTPSPRSGFCPLSPSSAAAAFSDADSSERSPSAGDNGLRFCFARCSTGGQPH